MIKYVGYINLQITFDLPFLCFLNILSSARVFFGRGGDETVKTFIYAKKHVNELDHKIVKRSLMLPHFISDFLHPAIIRIFSFIQFPFCAHLSLHPI
jgi:hypothetical protein